MADAQSLARLFHWRVKRSQNLPALRFRVGSSFRDLSFAEWHGRARRVARGLVALGVAPGERVALVCGVSAEWALVDLGCSLAGAVVAPLYPHTQTERILAGIAAAEARVVVVDTPAQLRALWAERHATPAVERFIVLHREGPAASGEPTEDQPDQPHLWLDELLDAWAPEHGDEQAAREERLSPSSPAVLVHTPGTTDAPEPVLLTHGALAAQADGLAEALALVDADVLQLGQPPAWALSRALLLAALRAGCVTALSPDEATALDDARDVRPTVFAATSVLCERLYRAFVAELPDRSVAGQRVLAWARSLGTEVSRTRDAGRTPNKVLSLQRSVASRLAFGSLRSSFGGRVRLVVCSGGRMPRAVAELFDSADMHLVEAYALAAAAGVVHVGAPTTSRPGSVGRAIPGLASRIVDDEVQVSGPSVVGADADGWRATGDLGRLDDEGLLWLYGRKSQRITLTDGHHVDPAAIEALLRQHPFVEYAAVCGDGRPYIGAILSLDRRAVMRWAERRSLSLSFEELCSHPDVYRQVEEHVQAKNGELADFEAIRKTAVADAPPTVETGDLTPIGLLRRWRFLERYRWIVDSFYSEAY